MLFAAVWKCSGFSVVVVFVNSDRAFLVNATISERFGAKETERKWKSYSRITNINVWHCESIETLNKYGRDEASDDDDGDEEKRPQSKCCSHVASICYFDSIYVANEIFGRWFICKHARIKRTLSRYGANDTCSRYRRKKNSEYEITLIYDFDYTAANKCFLLLFLVSFVRHFHPMRRRSDWSRIWKRLKSVSFVKFKILCDVGTINSIGIRGHHLNPFQWHSIGSIEKNKIWIWRMNAELTSVPWTLSFMWSSRVVFPSFRFFQQYPSRR